MSDTGISIVDYIANAANGYRFKKPNNRVVNRNIHTILAAQVFVDENSTPLSVPENTELVIYQGFPRTPKGLRVATLHFPALPNQEIPVMYNVKDNGCFERVALKKPGRPMLRKLIEVG